MKEKEKKGRKETSPAKGQGDLTFFLNQSTLKCYPLHDTLLESNDPWPPPVWGKSSDPCLHQMLAENNPLEN